jgi:hypothetical protein
VTYVLRWMVGLVQLGACSLASIMSAVATLAPRPYGTIPYALFMNMSSFIIICFVIYNFFVNAAVCGKEAFYSERIVTIFNFAKFSTSKEQVQTAIQDDASAKVWDCKYQVATSINRGPVILVLVCNTAVVLSFLYRRIKSYWQKASSCATLRQDTEPTTAPSPAPTTAHSPAPTTAPTASAAPTAAPAASAPERPPCLNLSMMAVTTTLVLIQLHIFTYLTQVNRTVSSRAFRHQNSILQIEGEVLAALVQNLSFSAVLPLLWILGDRGFLRSSRNGKIQINSSLSL